MKSVNQVICFLQPAPCVFSTLSLLARLVHSGGPKRRKPCTTMQSQINNCSLVHAQIVYFTVEPTAINNFRIRLSMSLDKISAANLESCSNCRGYSSRYARNQIIPRFRSQQFKLMAEMTTEHAQTTCT